MDHLIDYIEEYMKLDIVEFRKEMKNSTNKKMSDCPSYGAVKAYCEALRPLYQYYYGMDAERPTPSGLLELEE